ncbi:MAG: hypothetical protein ACHQ8D_01625 [Candidatus Rokuibacteriota bacterium]|jgi:hypothetical protein
MPESAKRSGPRLVARAIVLALLVLAALPAYLTVAPKWRPAATRLACAAAVAVGCARARRRVRDVVAAYPLSVFDVPSPPPLETTLDPRFLRLRDDLVASSRRRRYFDVVFWPRLLALGGPDLPRPAERRLAGRRGPSLRALGDLITYVERRP